MLGARNRTDQSACDHADSITATSNGLRRSVCELCGNVSFEWTLEVETVVGRAMFAREADLVAAD